MLLGFNVYADVSSEHPIVDDSLVDLARLEENSGP